MTHPPVCILTAGRGTRMGPLGATLNKALLPIDRRATITHIIERFDPAAELVIATGYQAQQVRDYLGTAHPERRFTFVTVEHHEGPGSGPGRSLLACAPHLQRPFVFVSCDTLWESPTPAFEGDWAGLGRVPAAASDAYCNLRLRGGTVIEIADKRPVEGDEWYAFTGLLHVSDHATFWPALEAGDPVAGEAQVSAGLRALVERGTLRGEPIVWTDVGDEARYREVCLRYESFDFSKANEAIYVVGDRVIKFFADEEVTARRVRRAAIRPAMFPAILEHRRQFYAYRYAPGATLYESLTPPLFERLLARLQDDLWDRVDVPDGTIADACRRFYREKTLQRVERYREKYGLDRAARINGVPVPPLDVLLEKVPWEVLEDGIPATIHGDLQFDNIIYDDAADRFVLLDWRQDFAGSVEFGDLYYDLAKLWGGIVLNYDHIKRNLLRYDDWGEDVFFDFAQRFQAEIYLRMLRSFVEANGWRLEKVRLLVPLIYLNMSPLHSAPFDQLLHALGRSMLAEELEVTGA